ncbi:hypothetical protein WAJ00_21680, partial [Acinetobacter baumannii]
QKINNKNSFLLTFSSDGEDNLQNFYPYNCCSIINYDNLINNKRVSHLSKQKITKYYLIVSYYRYKINTFIKDMKYIPLKEI